MAIYNVKVDVYIDDAVDSNAQATAIQAVEYTQNLAGKGKVAIGSAGERSSYALYGVIDPVTQVLTVTDAWHVSDSGAVSAGLPDGSGIQVREWAPSTDYILNDVVTYLGVTYTCLVAHRSANNAKPDTIPQTWFSPTGV